MMRAIVRIGAAVGLLASWVVAAGEVQVKSPEGIPKHQEEKIRAAVPDKPQVPPKKPRRVLIWNTPAHLMDKDPHKGYCIPYGACAMRILGQKTGAFEPVISDDLSVYLPDSLKRFDAVIFNNSSGPWITPSDAAMEKLKAHVPDKDAAEKLLRRSLLDFISGGRGIVAYHYAMGANGHWPEFRELLGAGYWGHPWNEEVGVKVEEPDHPILAVFGGKDFRVADEIFQFREPYSRQKLRVLLSLDTKTTNMTVKWIERKDGDFALAWVRPYGKGRVFYTALGHRTEIYWNPALLRLYLAGIQFATGDLEAPMTPREPPASQPAPAGRPAQPVKETRP